MKDMFTILNSVPSIHAPKVTVHRINKARDGEDSVTFSYGPVMPSQPSDAMGTETKSIEVGNVGTDDSTDYSVTASGEVDDQAIITLAGETYMSELGDNVPIDHTFTVKSGYYQVSVTQTNSSDVLPEYNESFLSCTITGCKGVISSPRITRSLSLVMAKKILQVIPTMEIAHLTDAILRIMI